MNPFLIFFIITFTLIVDCLWLDTDLRRWGWMKHWSNKNKALFFGGFIAISSLIYIGLSVKFF